MVSFVKVNIYGSFHDLKGELEAVNLIHLFQFRLVMIGDGMTDLEAYPPADLFIGFGGNKIRKNVQDKAPWFVMSFLELISQLNDVKVR